MKLNTKPETHFINRSGWLRAAVLGANDGILSTTSLVIGIAAASDSRNSIVLAAVAGLTAGALSMAAGEYVSVSSQSDIEYSDLEREKKELEEMPEAELQELTEIYIAKGLKPEMAHQVAIQLTNYNALKTHAHDELGINEMTRAKPFQAAMASAIAFIAGAVLPLAVAILAPINYMVIFQYVFAILFLAVSGSLAAKAGGSKTIKSILRICLWGTVAMCISALVGYIFGVQTI